MARLVGSPSAWNIISTGSRCLSIHLSMPYSATMRALVQRVTRAAVRIEGEQVATIGPGLLVLLGVSPEDDAATAERLAEKVRALRVFGDGAGHMNLALGDREIL